jgi:hypothetical protein
MQTINGIYKSEHIRGILYKLIYYFKLCYSIFLYFIKFNKELSMVDSVSSKSANTVKVVLLSLIVSMGFMLIGCGRQPAPLPYDPRECAVNFTYDGSFAAGRTFRTNVTISKVTQAQAMKRAASFIVSEGWQITNTNNELGIISASQTVSYGHGKTAPLNVGITKVNNGVQAKMTFSISGGLTTPVEGVRNYFCSIAGAIEGK